VNFLQVSKDLPSEFLFLRKLSIIIPDRPHPGTPATYGFSADLTPLDIDFFPRYLPPHQSSRVMLGVDVVAGHTKQAALEVAAHRVCGGSESTGGTPLGFAVIEWQTLSCPPQKQ